MDTMYARIAGTVKTKAKNPVGTSWKSKAENNKIISCFNRKNINRLDNFENEMGTYE